MSTGDAGVAGEESQRSGEGAERSLERYFEGKKAQTAVDRGAMVPGRSIPDRAGKSVSLRNAGCTVREATEDIG